MSIIGVGKVEFGKSVPPGRTIVREVRRIPAEQTPAEKLRRIAISMMRELARNYPKEYAEIGRELISNGVK